MTRRGPSAPLLPLGLERPTGRPPGSKGLHLQLYDQIRDLVLSGRLPPGTRLASSRGLAVELGCSRNTVMAAFEQLVSEGYLEGRPGSGTFVPRILPEQLLSVRRTPARVSGSKSPAEAARALPTAPRLKLAQRGRMLAGLPPRHRSPAGPFVQGVPETGLFPFDVWGRLLGRTWRRPSSEFLRHGDPAGQRALREAIAAHLCTVRALRCDWRQVLITSGAQQAVDLVARVLLDPGDTVWIEDPGYPGLRGPLLAAGARLVPVAVDDEGLSLVDARKRAPDARLALVTPSHQHPLGVTMSLTRRLELLAWARSAQAWILEDDYDSEYRYAGRPLAALQGLDADAGGACVLYVGTFSKVLFPSLRIGYLVVPPDLIEPFTRVRSVLDDHPSAVVQPALAAFIEEGHFSAHVRRMRALYGARRQALLDAGRRHLDGLLELEPDEAGLHLVARLAPELAARMSDREASARAAAGDIVAPPLSSYFMTAPRVQGLLLGYATVTEVEIESGARRLAEALRVGKSP